MRLLRGAVASLYGASLLLAILGLCACPAMAACLEHDCCGDEAGLKSAGSPCCAMAPAVSDPGAAGLPPAAACSSVALEKAPATAGPALVAVAALLPLAASGTFSPPAPAAVLRI